MGTEVTGASPVDSGARRDLSRASFIVTHRDPAEVLASVSSLIATLRRAFSDDVDPVEIGRYHLELYARSLGALVDHTAGTLPVDRTVHVTHTELVAGPTSTVRRVYDALGIAFGDAEANAAADAAAVEREDGVGAHRYHLADFGLDPPRSGRGSSAIRTDS